MTDIIDLALTCYRRPLEYQDRLSLAAPLPEGMDRLLWLANGSPEILDAATRQTGANPQELRDAARFCIQQWCLVRDADPYRMLGVEPNAAPEQIKEHYRLLMRLFHPDRVVGRETWTDHYASRINAAWTALSRPPDRVMPDNPTYPRAVPDQDPVRPLTERAIKRAGPISSRPLPEQRLRARRRWLPQLLVWGGLMLTVMISLGGLYLERLAGNRAGLEPSSGVNSSLPAHAAMAPASSAAPAAAPGAFGPLLAAPDWQALEQREQQAHRQAIQVRQERRQLEQDRQAQIVAEEALLEQMRQERAQLEQRVKGEQARAEQEWNTRLAAEQQRLAQLQAEQARVEQARAERERADRRRLEALQAEQAKAERLAEELRSERQRLEQAKAERVQAERLAAEQRRLALEQQRLAQARAEQAQAERLAAEQQRLALEQQRLAQARAEQAQAERLAAEQQRLAQVKAEQARAEQAKPEQQGGERRRLEELQAERARTERAAAELRTEQQRLHRLKTEQARAERSQWEEALRAERDRSEQAQVERKRLEEALKAERARIEQARAEQTRLEQERADQARAQQGSVDRGITARDLEILVSRYTGAYQRGDIDGLMALFDRDARSNGGKDRTRLRRDYASFFGTTHSRSLRLSNLNWDRRGDSASGGARFQLQALGSDGARNDHYQGNIRFEVLKRDQRLLIKAIYYDIQQSN